MFLLFDNTTGMTHLKTITTCFGPQLAIVRLYTLKRILNTICKYLHLDVEISYILTLFVYS